MILQRYYRCICFPRFVADYCKMGRRSRRNTRWVRRVSSPMETKDYLSKTKTKIQIKMALGFFPSLHFNRLLYDWTKDDRKSNKGRIDLELFVYHPGYQWIGELILTKLDVKTVAKLRLVSQVLRQFVDESRHWWVLHSRLLRQRTKTFPIKTYPHRIRVFYPFYYREQREHVLDRYPTNQQVFRFFENQARLLDLKFFIDCINRHVDELWDHHRKCF